jgi:AcrR family transcriptional regulator
MTSDATRRGGPGRRPGKVDTKGQILEAARAEFAAKGFDRTTIRAVAAAAAVDPGLVHHYFGTKDDLFVAAMELPFDPRMLVPLIVGQDVDGLGERLVRTFLGVFENPDVRERILGLIRSAVTVDHAAAMTRDLIDHVILTPVADALGGGDDARFRVTLVGSHLVGLALARYVLRLEPLASATSDQIIERVGPTVQRYLST